jgi:predicted RNase H-related nuclease YkuK (DUF458 family)
MERGMKGTWRTITGERIDDLLAFVRVASAGGQRTLHIGTDSLQRGRLTQFVTVLAILNPGTGGRAAYKREVRPRIESLRERLLREVWLSIELGLELVPVIPKQAELQIHIDANPVPKHRSSRYVQELVGMAVSQGFRAVIKPDSWAASHTADRLVRGLAGVGSRPTLEIDVA